MIDLDAPAARRAVAGGAVLALHVLVLAALLATGHVPPVLRAVLPARLILPDRLPPPPPPRLPIPTLSAPPTAFVPPPEIVLAEPPPATAAIRAVQRARPTPAASHFGAATDTGLGLDVAASSGGGSGARGSLAGFEAAVRRRVLAGKRQPVQAWDRRNTCVVAYTVRVSAAGDLAGYSIEPCGVPELNEAARRAIRAAAPFTAPPALGGATTEVHGSLVFHP